MGNAVSRPPRLDASRVRAVIFDLDGTLVDSYAAIAAAVNHARAAYGMPPLPAKTVRATVGRGLECLLAELLGADRVDDGVRLFRDRYAEVFRARTVALPGAGETLERLHRAGYAMAVASNKPARFGRPILEALGLATHLGAVHGPDTAGATKPDPAMLRRAMADLGVTAAETLYVGDMPLDVVSAAAAEVAVALVPGGSADAAALRVTGEVVLPDLRALPELLQVHRGDFRTPAT